MNKKHLTSLLVAGTLPFAVFAGGNHAGGHEMNGHDMASMYGRPGDPAKVDRTVVVEMHDDMRFTPSSIEVKAGETIRFFVKNTGRVEHEMVLGSLNELKEHAAMMRNTPDMRHDEPNMIKLRPGQRDAIVWQFAQPGTVDFACTIPGHLEAGMVGKILVK